MSIATLTIDNTVDLITKGIEAEFKKLLYSRLAEHAQLITEQCAKDAAANVTARVTAYNNTGGSQVVVAVAFNDKVL